MTTLSQLSNPKYADIFRYIGMPGFNDTQLSQGSQQQGAPYTVNKGYWTTEQQGGGEGGTQDVQVWHAPTLTESADVPDQYKGIMQYDPNVVGKEGRDDIFQLNPEILAKFPKVHGRDISQFGSLGTGEKPGEWEVGAYGQKLANPKGAFWDDNYGWLSDKRNFYDPQDKQDALINAAIMSGLTLGAGGIGVMPGLAMSAVGAAKTFGDTGNWKNALLNVLPGLISAGLPSFEMPSGMEQLLKFGKVGYGAYNAAKSHNPFGAIGPGMTLAQLAGLGGG